MGAKDIKGAKMKNPKWFNEFEKFLSVHPVWQGIFTGFVSSLLVVLIMKFFS